MRTLLVLLDKEFRQFFRNPFLPKMVVMFPLMVMFVIPWVTTMDVRHIGVAVVDNDRSDASRRLIAKLGASDYFSLYEVSDTYAASLETLEAGGADVIVEIPDDFERDRMSGTPRKVSIAANGVNALKGSLGSQYVTQTVMRTLAELRDEQGQTAASELITVQNRYNPTLEYRYYMIPALMIMLLIMLCGFLPALNLVGEKETGTIEQINVTPVSRFTFTLAKLIPFWIVGLLVLTVVVLVAWWLYGLFPAGSLGAVSGVGAVHPYHVGRRRYLRQPLRDDAADDVRHVLLRDDIRPDERTHHPDRVHARVGAGDHALPAAPLLHRSHAFGLPQGNDDRRIVGQLRRAGVVRRRVQPMGRTEL